MDLWKDCKVPIDGADEAFVLQLTCIPILFNNLFSIALNVAGTVAAALIIWGGIKYIRSGGDPKQADAARQTITWAVIGLVVVFTGYYILIFISNTLDLDCIRYLTLSFCNTEATAPTS